MTVRTIVFGLKNDKEFRAIGLYFLAAAIFFSLSYWEINSLRIMFDNREQQSQRFSAQLENDEQRLTTDEQQLARLLDHNLAPENDKPPLSKEDPVLARELAGLLTEDLKLIQSDRNSRQSPGNP
jgi:hypothetical protein